MFHTLVQWDLSCMLWFVHIQISHMQLVQLADTWANPGKEHWKAVQWIYDTYDVLLMFAYNLEEPKMESLGMLILILLETLIEEDLSQVMSLQSEVVQSVGKPLWKLQSFCLPLKLSTWRLLKLVKKLFD